MDTVEKYLHRLPDNELELAVTLRDWLLRLDANISERLRYGIPFFDYHGWMCYINPLKDGGIDFCFLDGMLIERHGHLLDARGRKTVKSLVLKSPDDLNFDVLHPLMQEAMQLRLRKKKKS